MSKHVCGHFSSRQVYELEQELYHVKIIAALLYN